MKHLHRFAVWLAFPLGAALALAFAPFNIWPLAIGCLLFLFLSWENQSARRAAKIGFLFSSGTFLAGTYWIYHSVHVIGQAPLWVALLLMCGLVAIMGAYTALLGYVQARWLPISGAWRWLVVLPAAWTMLEWFRGWFLSGFPWLAVGYSQTDTPLAATAPIGGVYFTSLLVAISAGALVTLILGRNKARTIAVAVIVAIWAGAAALWGRLWTEAVREPISVAVVQGAVPQEMKWSERLRDATLVLYRDLTRPHLGRDLILWPESALPIFPHENSQYMELMRTETLSRASVLVTGLQKYELATGEVYNGLLVLGREDQWYYKRRLVPFGEFFPVPEAVRDMMRMMNLPHRDFSRGEAEQPALRAAGEKLAATICYEDAYGAEQLQVLREATLLVNVSNDAWFGDSTARHQHLQISRMRALEAGRTLLRATNDGISAIIAADGTVQASLPNFKPGVLIGEAQPRQGLTPYARLGNWPVVSLCGLSLVFAYRRRRSRSASH